MPANNPWEFVGGCLPLLLDVMDEGALKCSLQLLLISGRRSCPYKHGLGREGKVSVQKLATSRSRTCIRGTGHNRIQVDTVSRCGRAEKRRYCRPNQARTRLESKVRGEKALNLLRISLVEDVDARVEHQGGHHARPTRLF
jgi:hypothetical protein